jgi:hypothetical protein
MQRERRGNRITAVGILRGADLERVFLSRQPCERLSTQPLYSDTPIACLRSQESQRPNAPLPFLETPVVGWPVRESRLSALPFFPVSAGGSCSSSAALESWLRFSVLASVDCSRWPRPAEHPRPPSPSWGRLSPCPPLLPVIASFLPFQVILSDQHRPTCSPGQGIGWDDMEYFAEDSVLTQLLPPHSTCHKIMHWQCNDGNLR